MVSSKFLNSENKHLFSFFFSEISDQCINIGSIIVVKDFDLVHRLVHVVRLQLQEQCVLFDRDSHALVKLVARDKKSLSVQVVSYNKNQELIPDITFLLPVLKKEALETALYSLAELGVNKIQLVVTEKSRQVAFKEKDMQRLQKIIIAAAEQSKAYRFPTIYEPLGLSQALEELQENSTRVLFDIQGISFFDIRKNIKYNKVYLGLGPEGGLTGDDKKLFNQYHFDTCSLTQTVLRSLQAVAIGTALFRI